MELTNIEFTPNELDAAYSSLIEGYDVGSPETERLEKVISLIYGYEGPITAAHLALFCVYTRCTEVAG